MSTSCHSQKSTDKLYHIRFCIEFTLPLSEIYWQSLPYKVVLSMLCHNQKSIDKLYHIRDWSFNLQGGGGYGFLFRSKIFFRTTRELEYLFFFQNLTLGYMTKTLNKIIIFFLHQNQNIFFSNIGNQNIFLEKNHNPPWKLNGLSLRLYCVCSATIRNLLINFTI